MTVARLTIVTCDRCEKVEEIREDHQIYPWAQIGACQVNGPFKIGDPNATKRVMWDICPSCAQGLKHWWENVEQPK